jgi:hypothetical protein
MTITVEIRIRADRRFQIANSQGNQQRKATIGRFRPCAGSADGHLPLQGLPSPGER